MDALESTNYDAILRIVRNWPPAKRYDFVHDVLDTLAPEGETTRPRRNTLDRALGLLTTGRPAPPDAEIRRWVEEHRLEKYG